ncbi:hypothetical protein ACWGJB_25540 [Streptomyces sp. NPDC054813]
MSPSPATSMSGSVELDVRLRGERLVDAPADDLMVVEEKCDNLSFFAHDVGLAHELFPWPGAAG